MCSGKILTSTPQKLLVTNSSICHYPEYKPRHQDYWVQLAEKPQRKRPCRVRETGRGLPPASWGLHRGLVPYAYNPSPWEGGWGQQSEVWGHSRLQCKFETSLGYLKPCLKQIKTLTKKENPNRKPVINMKGKREWFHFITYYGLKTWLKGLRGNKI